MKLFQVNDRITMVCESKKTRSGFKHEGSLCINGAAVASGKICYQNRTWERFEFESLMRKLAKQMPFQLVADREAVQAYIRNYQEPSPFSHITAVAKLGAIFADGTWEEAAWKTRMLKAGLGEQMQLPDDSDQLADDVKLARVNAAIEALEKMS